MVTVLFGAMLLVEMYGFPGNGDAGKFARSRTKTFDELNLVSGLLSQRVGFWFEEKRRDIELLAESPFLKTALHAKQSPGFALVQEEFRLFSAIHQGIDWLVLVGYQGSVLASSQAGHALPRAFVLTDAQLATLLVPGYRESLSLVPDAGQRLHLRVVRQVLALDDPERVVGLLVAYHDIEAIISDLLWASSNEIADGWECRIAAVKDGEVTQISKRRGALAPTVTRLRDQELFHPIALALQGMEGPYEGLDEAGRAVLAFHRQIRIDAGISLGLVIKTEQAAAVQPAWDDLSRQLYRWLLMLLGVSALGLVVANQIARPIRRLSQVARQVAAGNLDARVSGQDGGEIGQLGQIFNAMVARMQAWNNELEALVQERTRDLQALTARQTALLSAVPDIITEIDPRRVCTWANAAGLAFFGSDVVGRQADDYFYGENNVPEQVAPLFTGQESLVYLETWQRRSDGAIRLLAWWCRSILNQAGAPIGVLSTARDITEQHQAAELLRKSLAEKETLIQEIYHRTKNTLQIIQGIIMLQSAQHPANADLQNLVADTDRRIQSIAIVHQMLYRSNDLSRVSILGYLEDLIRSVKRTLEPDSARVVIEVNAIPAQLSLDTIIPLGLVVNELLTNSFKYAFKAKGSGTIKIDLSQPEPGRFHFRYQDDGGGLPELPSQDWGKSLGMRLIHDIAEHQLQGKLAIQGNAGFSCSIEFRDLHRETRV